MYTMIFETFIFLSLFNEFNCRNISPSKYNMFGNLLSSWLFLLVVGGTFLLTILFVQFLGQSFRVTPLDSQKHATCILYGASVLVISIVLKLIPESIVNKVPIFLDENKEIDPNDPVMAAYNKQASAKALNIIKVEEGGEHMD